RVARKPGSTPFAGRAGACASIAARGFRHSSRSSRALTESVQFRVEWQAQASVTQARQRCNRALRVALRRCATRRERQMVEQRRQVAGLVLDLIARRRAGRASAAAPVVADEVKAAGELALPPAPFILLRVEQGPTKTREPAVHEHNRLALPTLVVMHREAVD